MSARKPEAAAKAPAKPTVEAAVIVERDLSLLTGLELATKYGKPGPAHDTFVDITGKEPTEFSGHNPFWHYVRQVWFDGKVGRRLLCDKHREMADWYLAIAIGQADKYDGNHLEFPRRALKSTFLAAFADWVPKRHKLVDGFDCTVLYTHNVDRKAKNRLTLIKRKNQRHKYILTYFAMFVIPRGEWGTQDEWDWPCRDEDSSVAEKSMTAMSAAAKKAGDGYQYKLLDDWEDEDSRTSDVRRDELVANYDQLRALKAVPFSREISAGTPYHIHGLYRPMREQKHSDGTPRYNLLIIPALTDDNSPNFPTIPALTVEGLARERANEIARTGSDIFWYLQYQLDPRLTGTQTMEWGWFQPITVAEYRKKFQMVPHFRGVFVDSAWKGTEKQEEGCDTAIGVVGIWQIGSNRIHILLDLVVSNELVSDEGAAEMIRLMRKWQTHYYAIEQQGEKTFDGTMRAVARASRPPIQPYSIDLKGWTKAKKEQRIGAVAGSARMGWFYYLADIPHLPQFRVQVQDHPHGVKKDIVDMLGNAFAPEVVSKWVPVGIEEYVPPPEPWQVKPDVYITRHTHVPAFH